MQPVMTGISALAALATLTAFRGDRAAHCRTTQLFSDAASATAIPALEMRTVFLLPHVMPNSARPPMRAVSAVLRERAQRQTPWADGVAWTTKQHATKLLVGGPASMPDPQRTVLVTPALAAAPQPIVSTVVSPVHSSLATSRKVCSLHEHPHLGICSEGTCQPPVTRERRSVQKVRRRSIWDVPVDFVKRDGERRHLLDRAEAAELMLNHGVFMNGTVMMRDPKFMVKRSRYSAMFDASVRRLTSWAPEVTVDRTMKVRRYFRRLGGGAADHDYLLHSYSATNLASSPYRRISRSKAATRLGSSTLCSPHPASRTLTSAS